jgi:hypothetical protein
MTYGQAPDYTLLPEADTFISGKSDGNYVHGHPDSTGDNYTLLVIKNEGEPKAGNSFYREVLLRFDLSEVKEEMGHIELKLFATGHDDPTAYEDTIKFGAYFVSQDDWDETTVCWNTAPIPDFDLPLQVVPLFTHVGQVDTIDGIVKYHYGWTAGGDLSVPPIEAERQGDGKITLDIWAQTIKIYGETKKTWTGFVSKDSAAMVEMDIAPRLLIWKKGNEPTGVETVQQKGPIEYALKSNYPNPFNPSTIIGYTLAETAVTRILIFNALGQKVKTFHHVPNTAGSHSITWNGLSDQGRKVPSGLYFYQLKSGDFIQTRKMVLIE